jgi:hypothetical protein
MRLDVFVRAALVSAALALTGLAAGCGDNGSAQSPVVRATPVYSPISATHARKKLKVPANALYVPLRIYKK